jgi:hypothetical protein
MEDVMKIILDLQEFNLNATIYLLKKTLEAPFFNLNEKVFSSGKVFVHHMMDFKKVSKSNKKRPLIFFKYNGSDSIVFYENDNFIFDDKGNITVKSDINFFFSLSQVTKKEASLIENKTRLNQYYFDNYLNSIENELANFE